MSESKVVSRKTAVCLGVVCILLAVGLVADRLNYISIIGNKDAEFQSYVSTHKHSNAQYDALQSAYKDYVANQNHTEAQYDALNSQYDELKKRLEDLQKQVNKQEKDLDNFKKNKDKLVEDHLKQLKDETEKKMDWK